jgi:RNA polymerase sigma-70 factor (ECF subfamily)
MVMSLATPWISTGSTAEFGEELERFVCEAASQAQLQHPEIVLDAPVFVAYVAARVPVATELRTAHWGDLYLACACGMSHPAAPPRLDAQFLSHVGRYIANISSDPAFVAEVRQLLLMRLIGREGAPGILDYSGRGPLGGWLRVAAIRVALNLERSRQRTSEREEAWGEDVSLPPQRSPELELLRQRCAADVRVALEETLAGLERDARNVLRMHYIDGLSIDDIGVSYGVHRATIARWIQKAQSTVLAGTRRRLADRLRLRPAELDSLIALVQTSLNVSLRRLLTKPEDPETA